MAELTINTADIAAALQKNLEGFSPDMEAAQVGRVIEVGDGIVTLTLRPFELVTLRLTRTPGSFPEGSTRPEG